jgi:hypothetical protein
LALQVFAASHEQATGLGNIDFRAETTMTVLGDR